MRGSEGGLDGLCRGGVQSSTVTTIPRPAMRPTSVVVVLRGIPLKCLREDMAIASVLEILAMVS